MKARNYMEENEVYTPVHSYDEVMRAIGKLPEEEKNIILNQLKLAELASLLDSAEKVKEYLEMIQNYINIWTTMCNAICSLYKLVNTPDSATDNLMTDYDKLDGAQKKETALRLLNNSIFQTDCCDILIKDVEKAIENDSTLKALDNLFGITKYFKRCVRLGIGTNHRYEVEQ